MTARGNKQPAFLDLHECDGRVVVWVNRTLLPSLSISLQRHQHPSLQDFSTACTQVYRGEKKSYENDHCSIKTEEMRNIPGVSMSFHKDVLEAASGAFMSSDNRAVGKIGVEFRKFKRKVNASA